ncbi:MAG TPA: hypothetical protein VEC06_12700 [Paucimonas sp.]|nr:hypothetical protein [Paucimonas sp.]
MHLRSRREERYVAAQDLLLRCAMLLGILWALPLTLLGLLSGIPILLLRGRVYVITDSTPALLIRGPIADYLLAHHPFGPMSAMAIGHVIIAESHGLTKQILTHELAHVRQASVWGALFPVAYLAASLWAWSRGQDAYWNNRFEVAARNAERHA